MKPCVQCKRKTAKWQEEHDAKNVYCGSICQQKYYSNLIGLKTKEINDDNIIGLESGPDTDGTVLKIEITTEQAKEMTTVKNLLEDAGADGYIPLPNVDAFTLLQIQTFFKYGEIETMRLTDQQFLALMVAASYLDFERLMLYLMPEWVNYRPFPGNAAALKDLVYQALYFYEGDDFNAERLSVVNQNTKDEFLKFRGRFLSSRPPRNPTGNEWQFVKACYDGFLPIVKHIVNLKKWRINPADYDNWAIRYAAQNGHLDVVKYLMSLKDDRINPAADDNWAIQYAAQNGHLDVVEYLLSLGDDRINPEALKNEYHPGVKNLYKKYRRKKARILESRIFTIKK